MEFSISIWEWFIRRVSQWKRYRDSARGRTSRVSLPENKYEKYNSSKCITLTFSKRSSIKGIIALISMNHVEFQPIARKQFSHSSFGYSISGLNQTLKFLVNMELTCDHEFWSLFKKNYCYAFYVKLHCFLRNWDLTCLGRHTK